MHLRSSLSWVFAVGVVFFRPSRSGRTDLLMRAVGFALTGSNDAEVRVIGETWLAVIAEPRFWSTVWPLVCGAARADSTAQFCGMCRH
jgi:hypothetical protein